MKIAHLSKPWLPVPSPAYGAIEKMLAELIHSQSATKDIYLFAPGGSITNDKVKLISLYEEGQGDKGLDRNTELAQSVHCAKESERLNIEFIHAHSVDPFLGLVPFLKIPSVFTFYSNPTPAGKILSQMANDQTAFTFLSESHRRSFPWIKKAEVIYFGVNLDNFPFSDKKQNYLAFVGSIADKKGILEAIEISRQAGLELKVAAKIRGEDKEFYEKQAREQLESSSHVEFLGELNDNERNGLLKNAKAMLFPIKWEEPLGMVMIESMAVGTPVIAFNRGSVPEIIEDGKTGFIVENISQAVKAASKLDTLNPLHCRQLIENKFDIKQTTKEFDLLYSKVLSNSKLKPSISLPTSLK